MPGLSIASLCVHSVYPLFIRFLALCLVIVWEPDPVQGLGVIGRYNSVYFSGNVWGLLLVFSAEGSPSSFKVALEMGP